MKKLLFLLFGFMIISESCFSQSFVKIGDTVEFTKEVKKEFWNEYIYGKTFKDDLGVKYIVLKTIKEESDLFKVKTKSENEYESQYSNLKSSILSQTTLDFDNIIMHNGTVIKGTVTEITEGYVKFKYSNEELINSISKNIISEIIFKSRRTQKITEMILVKSIADWEKVQITNLESDIKGLKKYGELIAKSTGAAVTNQGKTEAKAIVKLKKEAASKGCHIILLLNTTGRQGTYGVNATKSSVAGVGYKY